MRHRAIRPAAGAIRSAMRDSSPATPLAGVQAVWSRAVGPGIAAEAQPVSERDGVVTVACRAATWAQELDLLQNELLERLNAALEGDREGSRRAAVRGLRFTADRDRFYS